MLITVFSAIVAPTSEVSDSLRDLRREPVLGGDALDKSTMGYLPYTLALMLGDLIKVPVVVLSQGVSVWFVFEMFCIALLFVYVLLCLFVFVFSKCSIRIVVYCLVGCEHCGVLLWLFCSACASIWLCLTGCFLSWLGIGCFVFVLTFF